jgi:homoserine O-acetyltransferase
MLPSVTLALCLGATAAQAQTAWPNQREADFIIRNFRFASGDTLAEVRIHYITIGTPRRGNNGEVTNAVLLLHGTSGTSASWLIPTLSQELFGPGQPLDASQYFIVAPDGIGAGGSSKPSDGLKRGFPQYRYRDMVEAQHRLVTEGLGIRRLRLVAGTSMGGMHTWLWGTMYPDAMDGLVPIASQPTAMSGRNWLSRRIRIEAIKNDPDWNGGNYTTNPTRYVYTLPLGALTTESAVQFQEMAPTREAADKLYDTLVADARKRDANDQLYVIEASMDYDPSKELDRIRAKVLAINFADDEVNPPEIGVMEPAMARIRDAKYVLLPAGPESHGHYTYQRAALWKSHLAEFMKNLESRHE